MAVVVLASSCGGGPVAAEGDGVLDCDDGLVVRGADIVVNGTSETEVVEGSLAQWAAEGAVLVAFPDLESWSAVLDGRDVAVALPEKNGDGTWIVHDVTTCAEPDTGPAPIDGDLDCANDSQWSEQASFEPDAVGAPTAHEAMAEALEPFQTSFGGEIVTVSGVVGSLVIDQREQVVAFATQFENGTWAVATLIGCEGYRRES